jgi:hypothetical protein
MRYTVPPAGIGIFQDVTMRLLAERLLHDADGKTFVDGEVVVQQFEALRRRPRMRTLSTSAAARATRARSS